MKYNGYLVEEVTSWDNNPRDMIVWNDIKVPQVAKVIYYNTNTTNNTPWIALTNNGAVIKVFSHAANIPNSPSLLYERYKVTINNEDKLVYLCEDIDLLIKELGEWRNGTRKVGFSECYENTQKSDLVSTPTSSEYIAGYLYKCWTNIENVKSPFVCICEGVDALSHENVFRDITTNVTYNEKTLSLIRPIDE